GARATGVAPRIKSIWNSTWQTGGRPGRSLGKTFENSLTTVAGPLFLQFLGTVSSIPIVFSWGGSIRPEGFLSFILLLAVVIAAVAMVVLVVVDAIIRVVVIVSGVPSIIKLSFVIVGSLHRIMLC
ncbi:hypothetical protein Tco_1171026, partial [Tanacetum coccineum]